MVDPSPVGAEEASSPIDASSPGFVSPDELPDDELPDPLLDEFSLPDEPPELWEAPLEPPGGAKVDEGSPPPELEHP
jgi:hypothetical protein